MKKKTKRPRSRQKIQSKWHARHRKLWLTVARLLDKGYGGGAVQAKYRVFGEMKTDAEHEVYGACSCCYACMACGHDCAPRDGEGALASQCPVQWHCDISHETVGGWVHPRACMRAGSEYQLAQAAQTPEAAAEAARVIAYLPWDASKETVKYPEK